MSLTRAADAERITSRSFDTLPAAFAHTKPGDYQVTNVGRVFADLAVKLTPSDATRATRRVLEILERSPARTSPEDKTLVQMLAATVPRSEGAIPDLAAMSMRLGFIRATRRTTHVR